MPRKSASRGPATARARLCHAALHMLVWQGRRPCGAVAGFSLSAALRHLRLAEAPRRLGQDGNTGLAIPPGSCSTHNTY
jgi:hypothetical protein